MTDDQPKPIDLDAIREKLPKLRAELYQDEWDGKHGEQMGGYIYADKAIGIIDALIAEVERLRADATNAGTLTKQEHDAGSDGCACGLPYEEHVKRMTEVDDDE